MVFDEHDDDSDEDNAQKKGLLYGPSGGRGVYGPAASRDGFAQSRLSLDQETPRQSLDYGQASGGAYSSVPMRQSVDLPAGASAPKRGDFKDPWGN